MASDPAWFRIVSNPALNVGPTLPFVVGAIRDPIGVAPASPAAGLQELADVLTKMDNEAPATFGIQVRWCPGIGAHVAVCVSPGNGLTWNPADFDVGSRDALAARLWDLYGHVITAGQYSKNGDWHHFTEAELRSIRRILGDG